MLLVPEGSRRSNLDRLRRSPTTISARALRQALERLSEIEKLGMSDLDFSRIPPERVDALARQANAARAQAIARMPDDRRIATLVAFVSRLERTACDDALNLMDLELATLLTEADREGKAKRKKTLQTFDQAAVLLRDALLIVLDPTQEDLEHVREQNSTHGRLTRSSSRPLLAWIRSRGHTGRITTKNSSPVIDPSDCSCLNFLSSRSKACRPGRSC